MKAFLNKARKSGMGKSGEQSIKSLTKSGATLENVEIPGSSDIYSFKKTARKYNIDFSLQKDTSADPPNWIIFFKSKDSKTMDAAFKEFSKSVLGKKPAPSIAQEMERFKDIAAGKDKGIIPAPPIMGKDKGDIEL